MKKNGMPAQPNQSVASALECLLHIGTASRPVGSREMARELGIEHTKASRMLGTLAGLGLAEKTADRKYTPGPGIHVLAAMSLSGSSLLAAALGPIEALRKETKMLVALGVLWRDHVCYLYHGGPGQRLRAAISGHGLFSAQRSSIGMLLLSELNDKEVIQRLPSSPRSILAELKRIRKHNYALVEGNNQSMAIGISSPYIAGLAVSGTIDKSCKSGLLKRLHATAEAIEANMNMKENT